MWRVILVDDEKFVRMELKAVIPWQRYQFDFIGEADDARSAMELIEQSQPDLVITDIRMPGINGLELISWIVKRHPQITVAVISAYNDFHYVREALRLGAVDYLMKAEANLKTAGIFLERIAGILGRRGFTRRRQEELTGDIERYQRLAVEAFWRDVLARTSDEAELALRARQFGIDWENNRFGLIFMHVSNYHGHWRGQHLEFRRALEAEIQANWDWNWSWDLIDFRGGDFVIIASSVREPHEVGIVRDPACNEVAAQTGNDPGLGDLTKLQNIASRLVRNDTQKRTVSASSRFCPWLDLPGNFREVREVNLLRLYNQEGKYLEICDLLRLRQAEPLKSSEILAEWERLLLGNKPAGIGEFLKEVFQKSIPRCMAPEEARWLALDMIITLRRVAFERQVQWQKLEEAGRDPSEILEQAETIGDWQSQIENLSKRYLQLIKSNRNLQATLPVRKAFKYIQSNFTRDISLEEVAKYAGVSKSYLSRVFAEYAGENFCNYLQRLRVERAKELLRFTGDHIYEIATKVGFWNSRYFSRVFHETTGMTPAEYRRAADDGADS
ncbi:MAG: response regulator [Firmicutes bacterium]|nr:response regulator [Bacillota bacterium]